MSDYTVFVKVKPYIAQYFRQVYGNPARFSKKSFFNLLLSKFITIPPKDCVFDIKLFDERSNSDEYLQVQLPYCTNKNIYSHNYLTRIGEDAIARELRSEFYLALMTFVRNFLIDGFRQKKTAYINTAIKLFIEKHNLDVDCFNTLLKQYHRTETVKSRKKRKKKMSF
ncbi:MAG: hypothetical protein LBK94_04975 [Prevotellaceae bacterium]|jgi:hypothetical protein|nr:hypothetical protein [Prevotellaceae bacterium]